MNYDPTKLTAEAQAWCRALKSDNIEWDEAESTTITLGNGNLTGSIRSKKAEVTTGVGNQELAVLGNDITIKLDQGASPDWDSSNDTDIVGAIGTGENSKVSVDTGKGTDYTVAVADDIHITLNEGGIKEVLYYGKATIKENGDVDANAVVTANKAMRSGILKEDGSIAKLVEDEDGNFVWGSKITDIAGVNVGIAAINAAAADTTTTTGPTSTSEIEYNKDEYLKSLKEKYNLDDANMAAIEKLYDTVNEDGSRELFATFEYNGKTYPRYSIMKSVTQENGDGEKKNILCYNDYTVGSEGMHTRGLIANGKNYSANLVNVNGTSYGFGECVATEVVGLTDDTLTGTYIETTQKTLTYNSLTDLDIDLGNAKYTYINTSSKYATINAGDDIRYTIKGDNVEGTKDYDKTKYELDIVGASSVSTIEERKTTEKKASLGTNKASTYTSPLIIDMDKDGKVEAASGNGVDVNVDGIGDGYATGGDKMLAMSDINGNGSIDGNEVFGNNTVSPFSGKALNAANGFEALKLLAQEAEENTGIKCYNNGQVDLAALKSALATVGVNLGYISDSNTTEIEDLEKYDIASITVDDYEVSENETGDVQHRQQGTATTTDGTSVKTDDVWFRNRKAIEQIFDDLQ